MTGHHVVTLSGMPARGLRFPSFEQIQSAARRRDAAALSDLAQQVRDAMPVETPIDAEVIYAGHDRLTRISEELNRLSSIGLSDHGGERARARRRLGATVAPDESLPARVAAARAALDGARQGQGEDADVRARVEEAKRALKGGTG